MSDQTYSSWAMERAREIVRWFHLDLSSAVQNPAVMIAAALDEAEARGRAEVRQPEDLNYHLLIARAEHAENMLAAVKGERDEWLRNAEAWRDELAAAEARIADTVKTLMRITDENDNPHVPPWSRLADVRTIARALEQAPPRAGEGGSK